jgi:hypothetical protein
MVAYLNRSHSIGSAPVGYCSAWEPTVDAGRLETLQVHHHFARERTHSFGYRRRGLDCDSGVLTVIDGTEYFRGHGRSPEFRDY